MIRPVYLLTLAAVAAAPRLPAAPQEAAQVPAEEAPPAPATAFRARWIHPVASPPVEDGVLVVRGGRIEAVGGLGDVEVPEGTEVVDLGEVHVVPGLVDAHTRLFQDNAQARAAGSPDLRAVDGLEATDRDAAWALRHGVTTVYVAAVGTSQWLGQGAVLKLTGLDPSGDSARPRVLRESAGMDVRLTHTAEATSNLARGRLAEGLRTSLKAVEAYEKQWEEYRKALEKYQEDRKKWLEAMRGRAGEQDAPARRPQEQRPPQQRPQEQRPQEQRPPQRPPQRRPQEPRPQGQGAQQTTRPAGQAAAQAQQPKKPDLPRRPERKPDLEALSAVLKGEIPLRLEAHRTDEILLALDLAAEFKLKDVLLVAATEGGEVAGEIARAGAGVVSGPLVRPLRRPAHLRNHSACLPARLARGGVVVALGSEGGREAAARLLEAALAAGAGGWDAQEALRAVTLDAAGLLGVDDLVGSLEPGKEADFVVLSGPPLGSSSRVLRVVADGRTVHLAAEVDRRR